MRTLFTLIMMILFGGVAWAAVVPKVDCTFFQSRMIYHSPETPGYTSWVGFARTPENTLLCSFAQQTGKAPDVRGEHVVLESSDIGRTWSKVRPDGWTGFSRITAILPDGTLVQGRWPSTGGCGYIARSSDRGKTWSDPINFVDPKKHRAWPGVVKPLRDGRLVLFAGVLIRDPANPDINNNARMEKFMFVSADGGKTWGKGIQLMTIEEGVCEESDFCELPNGDLFWVHRCEVNPPGTEGYSDRKQSIAYKRGNSFVAGKVTKAPFQHSGYPAVLYTKEGLIMHLATDGIYWSADIGKTWHKLNNPATEYSPGTYYYPIAMQMDDGEIMVIGHRGWDDVYGTVDQAIMQQTFRIKVTR